MTDKPPVPRHSDEFQYAIEELVAQVDDPDVVMNGNEDSYGKCVEAMWQAGYLVTEYMARRLGMTPLQRLMAMEQLHSTARSRQPHVVEISNELSKGLV